MNMNKPHDSAIVLIKGDITQLNTDIIVNSANETLLGDDGVDGSIHIAAGPRLREYCSKLGGCRVAEVKITPSFNLPHKYIIHTVGPQYGNENGRESELLRACYRNCLYTADALGVNSVAFPSISTGQYGYPISEGSLIALSEIDNYLKNENNNLKKVVIVIYTDNIFSDTNDDNLKAYYKSADRLGINIDHC